jgi:hypothetical protein
VLRDAIEIAAQKALTIDVITAAWEMCGLWPFNPEKVLRRLPQIWPPPKDNKNVGSPRDLIVLSPPRLLPNQAAYVEAAKTAATDFVQQTMRTQADALSQEATSETVTGVVAALRKAAEDVPSLLAEQWKHLFPAALTAFNVQLPKPISSPRLPLPLLQTDANNALV